MANAPVSAVLLVVLSAVAVATSLHAWRNRELYGYYRFFALEAIVLSIVWNAGHWFRNPGSSRQIASWAMLLGGTLLAIHGSYLLKVIGQAQKRAIEDTITLVEVGAYRYIRHPLYASLLILTWGIFLKGADLASAALAIVATAFLFATARAEERFNIERFGAPYLAYMKRTRMLIPFVL